MRRRSVEPGRHRRRETGALEPRYPRRFEPRGRQRRICDERQRHRGDRDRPSRPVPFAVGPQDRDEEQEHERKERKPDDDHGLCGGRDQREQGKVAEEIPIGAGIGDHHRWVRRLAERGSTEDRREQHDAGDRDRRHDGVAPGGIGPERDASCEQLAVTRAIAGAVHALPRDRRLRDAALDDEVQVYAEEPEDRRRDQENVRRVEARERRAADVRSCNDQRHKPTADHGRLRCLFGCDDDGPERVLIPPQELPGECHRERAEEEQRS